MADVVDQLRGFQPWLEAALAQVGTVKSDLKSLLTEKLNDLDRKWSEANAASERLRPLYETDTATDADRMRFLKLQDEKSGLEEVYWDTIEALATLELGELDYTTDPFTSELFGETVSLL